MSAKTLRVAVVGGGVCGLACAIALQREEGVDVDVYEAAAKFGEIGAGIGLGRNAIRVLSALEVYEDVRIRALQTDQAEPTEQSEDRPRTDGMRGWFKFISGLGDHEALCDFGAKEKVSQGVHRAVFLDALVQHIDPKRAHFQKRCTHLTENLSGDGVTIHFQDGTTAVADVVLGADGIKSAVRRYVTDSASDVLDPHVKFSNTICYRALIPVSKAARAGCKLDYSERPICFAGKNKHLIIFTVRGGTVINVVAFGADQDSSPDRYPPPGTATVQQVTREEVLEAYEGWGPEAMNLLSCMENPTKWNISVVYPPIEPENWTRGNVAILGDAAHGMLPHLGAGAGQGVEDAYLLGKLLGHPQTTLSNIPNVLQAYAAVRQPRAQKVWEGSRRAGDMYEGRAGDDGLQFEELRATWGDVWDYPLDAGLEAATDILVKEGIFKPSKPAS